MLYALEDPNSKVQPQKDIRPYMRGKNNRVWEVSAVDRDWTVITP